MPKTLLRILLSAGAMALFGVLIATGLSLWALAVYANRGAAPFAHNGTTFLRAVSAYYVGGLLGGFAVGVVLPFLRGRLGAVIGGVIAVIPMYAAVAYTIEGSAGLRDWRIWIFTALLVGVPVGLGYRRMFSDWYDAAFGDDQSPRGHT